MIFSEFLREDVDAGSISAGNVAGTRGSLFGMITRDGSAAKKGKKRKLKTFFESVVKSDEFSAEDVLSKLDGAEKENKIKDNSVAYGIEDEEGNITKVYVAKEQEEAFKQALGEYLDDDKSLDVAEILFNLRNSFNILFVEWPKLPEDEEVDNTLDNPEANPAGGEPGTEGEPGAEGEQPPEDNYNPQKVGSMYKEYFESILNIYKETGWYTENPERRELEWLTKTQPTAPKTFKEILNQYNRIKVGKVNFLQIGAMDGVRHDELYPYVMSFDWTGVLVEPLPDMFERLVNNYSLKDDLKFENSAITETDGFIDMHRVPLEKIEAGSVPLWAEGCSTLVPHSHIEDVVSHMVAEKVRTISMETLIQKYSISKIDFIQIDTEGYDYNIFMEIQKTNLRPDLFKIEIAHITYTKVPYMRWVLEQQGYKTFIDNYDLIAYKF